ncbi:hypothetical protein [Chitinivorax sp. B]|uniref:hypothetical protein n=1 Tax=Chitinivorax sp. B TaxID=2502235 RepID=UPI0010F77291|nr:hypothetical protein [Chitinivorax sp. B]
MTSINTTSISTSRLQGALAKDGDNAHFSESGKRDLMKVAQFMDKHPEVFGTPDKKGSWVEELSEDNFLDKAETKAFEKGISMFSSAHAGAGNQVSGNQSGYGGTNGSNSAPKDDWGYASRIGNHGFIDMKNALDAESRLDGAIAKDGKGGGHFSPTGKGDLQAVAEYMDANPTKFGKPDKANSWAQELNEDNYLDSNELSKFEQGISDIKSGLKDVALEQGANATGGRNASGNPYDRVSEYGSNDSMKKFAWQLLQQTSREQQPV